MIERRQRADRAGHHRHRMGVAPEALEKAAHLLMHHGVARDAVIEVGLLRRRRQLAVQQQVAGLQEVAVLGDLLDRHAAVEQDARVAVDVGDLGLAGAGRGEAGVVGEHAGLGVELADVDHLGPDGAVVDREAVFLVADRKLGLLGVGAGLRVHLANPRTRRPRDRTVNLLVLSRGRRPRGNPIYLGYLIPLCTARRAELKLRRSGLNRLGRAAVPGFPGAPGRSER